ncbi:MAG: M28 family peptidase [Bacteroidetes bacterium]|nr:M28 family peptidase [Bacteroidota bacterium]
MKFRTLIVSSLLLLTGCAQQQERPAAQTTPQRMEKRTPHFDGDRAFRYLKAQTDFGPRNPNSPGHRACMAYLENELKRFTADVTLQRFTHKGYNETLQLANVIARFNPGAATRVLLVAHWDTRPRAEEDPDPAARNRPILGANDGASGVAVLLELARMFKENPPPIGVDILLTDGEDYGDAQKDGNNDLYFLGARHFARTKPASYTPQYGILLDMVGDRDLQLPLEQNSMRFAPQLMDIVWSTAEENGITQFIRVPGEAISDDHLPLNEAGIPTIDIIDFQYPYWHTQQDTPDKCSPQSLAAVGTVVADVIYNKLGR